MHLLIHPQRKYLHTPSKYIPYIHPQSKYPTYTLKSKYPTYTLKSKYPKYTLRTFMNIINKKQLKNFELKNCDQGVHDHDVLVDLVHISEGGKMQISPKLEVCGENKLIFGISDLDYVGIAYF